MYRIAEVWGSRTEHLITHTISSRVACETSHLARAIDEEELLTEGELPSCWASFPHIRSTLPDLELAKQPLYFHASNLGHLSESSCYVG